MGEPRSPTPGPSQGSCPSAVAIASSCTAASARTVRPDATTSVASSRSLTAPHCSRSWWISTSVRPFLMSMARTQSSVTRCKATSVRFARQASRKASAASCQCYPTTVQSAVRSPLSLSHAPASPSAVCTMRQLFLALVIVQKFAAGSHSERELDSGSDSEGEAEQAALDSMHSAPLEHSAHLQHSAPLQGAVPAADSGSSGEHQTAAVRQSLEAAATQAQVVRAQGLAGQLPVLPAPVHTAVLNRPPWLGSVPSLPWPLPLINKLSSWHPQPPFNPEDVRAPTQLKQAAADKLQKLLFLLCGGTRVSLRRILDSDAQQSLLEEATAGHSKLMAMVQDPTDTFDAARPHVRFFLNTALRHATDASRLIES